MSDELIESRLAAALRSLKPKTKQPVSATVLNNWITQAESKLGPDAKGGRLGWLVASSVAIAAVQRAVDADGRQLFLLKGGTLLRHRLNATARTTKDVDGIVRGDLDGFFLALEDALAEPWGPLALRRGEVEVVDVPARLINPRRFDITIELRGVTWRRIQFEISPDEAGIGDDFEIIEPPQLTGFGLPDPDTLVAIAMRFQIAQKLHAVSDPHDPPASINDRARDIVDLLLLRDLAEATGSPHIVRGPAVQGCVARYRRHHSGRDRLRVHGRSCHRRRDRASRRRGRPGCRRCGRHTPRNSRGRGHGGRDSGSLACCASGTSPAMDVADGPMMVGVTQPRGHALGRGRRQSA